jgi:hypothetical protein
MRAVGLVARAELRRRRVSLAVLAVLTAVVVATVLATLAGARRTASALDRFMDATAARDLQVVVNSADFTRDPAGVDELRQRLAAMDGVDDVATVTITPIAVSGTPYDFGAMASPDGGYFRAIDRPILVAGRLPEDGAVDEIALNETAVAQLGLGVGDQVKGPTFTPETIAGFLDDTPATDEATGPTLELTVVGIVRTSDELAVHPTTENPGGIVSPAFFDVNSGSSGFTMVGYGLRVDRAVVDDADVLAFVRDDVGADADVWVEWVDGSYAGEVRSAHRSLATGLLVSALIAAVAGVLTVALAVNRQLTVARDRHATMRGLGMERRQRALAIAAPSALAVVTGTVGGLLGAAGLSPLFPLSVARRAEVAPGFDLDLLVLGCGGSMLVAAMLAYVAWAASRSISRRAPAGSGRRALAAPAGRVVQRAGPSATVGVTMAVASGSGRRGVPARSAALGALVGVAGVVGVAVFLTSVATNRDEAYRYGWTWDTSPDLVVPDPEAVVARMVGDPDLTAVADVACSPVGVDGVTLYTCAFNDWKGATVAPTVAGRLPVGPAEIALGRETMRQLGVSIDDTVRSDTGDTLTVVGETVIPMIDNAEPGQGAIMTVAGQEQQRATDGSRHLLLTYAAGTDPASLEHRLEADYGVSFTPYSRPDPPGRLLQLDLMGGLLRGLGAFLIGLGMVGLVHFLGVSARRRRHDFGVLRALGFARRDLSLTMSWQAMSVVAVGVVAGVPLGVMVGRWAWLAAIGSVGMVDTPAVPGVSLVAIVVVAVGAAGALGAVPGWFAGRRPPADALRSE